MHILYGKENNNIDVTNICLEKLTIGGVIFIPEGDSRRASYFTDPLHGINKDIIIVKRGEKYIYNESCSIKINNDTGEITVFNREEINRKIKEIHSNLKISYGKLSEELPEQEMSVRYLTGDEKVLEIGGNFGRNSLVIAKILKNSSNLVTLESDIDISEKLIKNRDLNRLNFHVEASALSNRQLIQKGWDTIPSDVLKPGYKRVSTIKLEELKNKYNIVFDTLVLDCEGAFYYILNDMPEILNNINKILMENDYRDIDHYNYISKTLREKGFYLDYSEGGGWGPCSNNFFEVWLK